MKRAVLALLSACLLTGVVAFAHDGTEHVQGTVMKITAKAITLALEGKKTRVIPMNGQTMLMKGELMLEMRGLKPGDRVVVDVVKKMATSVNLVAEPDAAHGETHVEAAATQHEAGAHEHAAAAAIKNPAPADARSVDAGAKLYAQSCASCHGLTGQGDGKMAKLLKPPPSNLVDASWKHGSTDGEIFTLIRDGATGTPMKAFGKKLSVEQTWEVVNYLRSLGPTPGTRH